MANFELFPLGRRAVGGGEENSMLNSFAAVVAATTAREPSVELAPRTFPLAGPRPAQRLVRRRRDDVAVREGRGVEPCGDEAADVGHVRHEEGADLIGDGAELGEVDDAGVGGGPAEDHLRPEDQRRLAELLEVDEARLGVHLAVAALECVRWVHARLEPTLQRILVRPKGGAGKSTGCTSEGAPESLAGFGLARRRSFGIRADCPPPTHDPFSRETPRGVQPFAHLWGGQGAIRRSAGSSELRSMLRCGPDTMLPAKILSRKLGASIVPPRSRTELGQPGPGAEKPQFRNGSANFRLNPDPERPLPAKFPNAPNS